MTPPVTRMEGILTRPIPIRCAGTALSQEATKIPPSNGVAPACISIMLQIVSREASE